MEKSSQNTLTINLFINNIQASAIGLSLPNVCPHRTWINQLSHKSNLLKHIKTPSYENVLYENNVAKLLKMECIRRHTLGSISITSDSIYW